jgi:hypothetical protein
MHFEPEPVTRPMAERLCQAMLPSTFRAAASMALDETPGAALMAASRLRQLPHRADRGASRADPSWTVRARSTQYPS